MLFNMKSVRCLLLLQFYASKPRSVNLALETTFEFNNKQDVAIIERVRKFLNTIEGAVDKKLAVRLGDDGSRYEFTDFLRDVITTITSYDDDNLKAVFRALNEEVHNYRYRSSRFNEIMDNDDLRRRVVDVLRKTKEAPAQFLRDQLRKNLKALKRSVDKRNTSFLNFLNILYKRRSAETLRQTVENLRLYGKRSADSGTSLIDIIKTAVKALIYDKYSNLDESVRRDVKTWLETMARSSSTKQQSKQSQKKQAEKKTDRVKEGRSPRMYTFVTLYPEEIHFEVKKSIQQRTLGSPTLAWTERTVPNKSYFYLVKAPSAVKGNGVGDDDELNSSSSSHEDAWRTHRREATSALWLARHQKQKSVSKVSKQISRIKEILNSHRSDKWLRRAGNDNTTELPPENYLERIRRLETELNRMKAELNAKISTTTDRLVTNTTVDEYSDYEPDKELYNKESNTTTAELHHTASPAVTETTEADAVFRSNNDTELIEVPTEVSLREFDGYNLTFRAVLDSSVAENEREGGKAEFKLTNTTTHKSQDKINTPPTTVAVEASSGGQETTKSDKLVTTTTEGNKNTTALNI